MKNGKLTIYNGNYSAYKIEKEIRRLRQHQLYSAQQKEIAKIKAAIQRFELWASLVVDERHIKQARHRRKMLERMEERGEIIEDIKQQKVMNIQLDGWQGSKKALEILDLSMGFDEVKLFENLNLEIRHKDRIGLVGLNGTGKSVLFKLILREIEPLSGGN